MCRLYGFRGTEPTKVDCTLVHAQNAVLRQSARDERGLDHAHGWGIAAWADGCLEVERRSRAAFLDLHFATAAERVYATTVIAHVRRATVGVPSLANTHPFRHGCWAFAHNGTVTGFDRIGPLLVEQTAPPLRACRDGSTDSETVFLWLMTRLAHAQVDLDVGAREPHAVRAVVERAIKELDSWCREAAPDATPRLNFLLSDGANMIASRWNHSLHYVVRHDVRDCQICGIAHIGSAGSDPYRAIVVASEPITDEPWQPVPEGHVIAVDRDVNSTCSPIDVHVRR